MQYAFKISIIGDDHVGKTSLIVRYIKDTFTDEYKATLGADFIDKKYTSENINLLAPGDELTVTFWDMAGQPHYYEMSNIYLRGSLGIIVVFDVNNPRTFQSMEKWKKIWQESCKEAEIMVVGNKIDLEKKITEDQIKSIEEEFDTKIEWTSAKMNENVKDVFEKMARRVLKKYLSTLPQK